MRYVISKPNYSRDNYLAHYGVQGMKWGVRNYQNADGTLTSAGRQRYGMRSTQTINRLRGIAPTHNMAMNDYMRARTGLRADRMIGLNKAKSYKQERLSNARAEKRAGLKELRKSDNNFKQYKAAKNQIKSDFKAAKKDIKSEYKQNVKAVKTDVKSVMNSVKKTMQSDYGKLTTAVAIRQARDVEGAMKAVATALAGPKGAMYVSSIPTGLTAAYYESGRVGRQR